MLDRVLDRLDHIDDLVVGRRGEVRPIVRAVAVALPQTIFFSLATVAVLIVGRWL